MLTWGCSAVAARVRTCTCMCMCMWRLRVVATCAGFEHAWVTALRSSRSSGSGSTALVHSTREVRSSSSKGGLGDAWARGRVRVKVRVRVGVRARVRVRVRVRNSVAHARADRLAALGRDTLRDR